MNHVLAGVALASLMLFSILPSAKAEGCEPIQGNTIIFGGLGSTTADMKQCYPDFLALSHDDGAKVVSCLAHQINNSKEQKFVIAGHSSGTKEAEQLVQLVQDKSRLRLVLLEGFALNIHQRGPVETTCWYAQNTGKKIQGFNAPSMLNATVCPQPARAFEADWCETPMCLHLANVNLNVPAGLTKKTVLSQGLANCRGNMDWVQENLDWLSE